MKLRVAALALTMAAACAPQAFADERFDSLRELLSNPDIYRDDGRSGNVRHDSEQRERLEERTHERESGQRTNMADQRDRERTLDRDKTQTEHKRETGKQR